MEKALVEGLEKLGLAEKEAKVYLACLELGASGASEIALQSDLPRTLIYDILERLIDIGIISYAVRGKNKAFSAAEPRELIRIAQEKEQAVQEILPALTRLQKYEGAKGVKVEVYEGIEGMKTVMNAILRSGVREFVAYGSSKSSIPIMPAFIEEWHVRRAKQKVFFRALYNDSPEAHARVQEFKHTFAHAAFRFMPVHINSPTATLIYGDFVVLQTWTKEPFSVVIESKAMAANQKRYFEELWKLAKPVRKQ